LSNVYEDADAGSQGNGRKPDFSLGMTQIIVEYHLDAQICLSDAPDLMYKERGIRTLEVGRDTGSNAKWLIRRSCRCVPCRLLDISFNFSTSFPEMPCNEGGVLRLPMFAGSISSLTEANRTVGEASAAFLGSRLEVVFCSGTVKKKIGQKILLIDKVKVKHVRN
jgi:hypothetical protein